LIAAALRGPTREDIIERVLAAHREQPVRLATGADLAQFALLPKERAVIELLQAEPASVERLASASGDPALARRVLYLLTLTKKLEVATPPRTTPVEPSSRRSDPGRFSAVPDAARVPPARGASVTPPPRPSLLSAPAGPPTPPEPPAGLSAEQSARYREIAEFIFESDKYNYFELLGVAEGASNDEITAAYAERVKRFHPDRLAPELVALSPYCQRLFHQLTEAKNALIDPDARLAHVRAMRSGGGTPAHDRKLSAIVSAAVEFQKVDVLVKQRRYDEALAILDQVLEVEPEEPDYLARKAWVLFLVHPEKRGPRALEILALAEKALIGSDKHEQAHFTKGSLLKRQGDAEGALV
ncbi:MAG: DnaJ domain-containing protein, partial [Polyangiaceae bacterium]|nr:DnaJ domain-containing protein [Polyangiaceae bacterium]